MKKLLLIILISLSLSQARTLTVEVCSNIGCETRTYTEVKKAEQISDQKGTGYVRITFLDGRLLDVKDAKVKKFR